MKIYVGYIMTDYSTPICMGLDKKTVETELKKYDSCYGYKPWIESYDLHKNIVVELNCD